MRCKRNYEWSSFFYGKHKLSRLGEMVEIRGDQRFLLQVVNGHLCAHEYLLFRRQVTVQRKMPFSRLGTYTKLFGLHETYLKEYITGNVNKTAELQLLSLINIHMPCLSVN